MSIKITRNNLLQKVQNIQEENFEEIAIQVFQYQATHNKIYAEFIKLLGKKVNSIRNSDEIPFLPIQFFKSFEIKTGIWHPEIIFQSSGTTGQIKSKHFVRDLSWYDTISSLGFESIYQPIEQYVVLALLPSYLERNDASLVYMIQSFIQKSNYTASGFFLKEIEILKETIDRCIKKNIPILLIGVSFALLDLAEEMKLEFPKGSIVMETGGMKGRRKELIRKELHELLKKSIHVNHIHSEYGMTELLSQAYAKQNGIFVPTPTMKIKIREFYDPLTIRPFGRGLINVIDLANIDSCSFIATDDIGILYKNDTFEVLGRMDNSELRGCNLMIG